MSLDCSIKDICTFFRKGTKQQKKGKNE
uniref:Uncharacterized protein n=1 Tax=Arundo donax TaxID=35708 RepID=A0A0A9BBQ6_ARUDO